MNYNINNAASKIKLFQQEIAKHNVDERTFLIYMSQGMNGLTEWSKYSHEEMYLANIDWNEAELEREIEEQDIKDFIEVEMKMYLAK